MADSLHSILLDSIKIKSRLHIERDISIIALSKTDQIVELMVLLTTKEVRVTAVKTNKRIKNQNEFLLAYLCFRRAYMRDLRTRTWGEDGEGSAYTNTTFHQFKYFDIKEVKFDEIDDFLNAYY